MTASVNRAGPGGSAGAAPRGTESSASASGAAHADVAEYALRLGDDALVLAQRMGEWISRAPELEEDVALANIGLDLLGQARALLSYAGSLTGRTEDELAYFRTEDEFRAAHLMSVPRGDFAVTICRMLIVSAYQRELYARLAGSADATLAGIAGKAVKEVTYHLDHARGWTVRLGDGVRQGAAAQQGRCGGGLGEGMHAPSVSRAAGAPHAMPASRPRAGTRAGARADRSARRTAGGAKGEDGRMSDLEQRLQQDLTSAIRERDELTTATLRMALTATKNEAVSGSQARELTDDEVLAVLTREAKKRRESAQAYDDAQRPALAERERAELSVLTRYLPAQLGEDELRALVDAAVARAAADGQQGMRAMGAVMRILTPQTTGRADGGRVAALVKDALR